MGKQIEKQGGFKSLLISGKEDVFAEMEAFVMNRAKDRIVGRC